MVPQEFALAAESALERLMRPVQGLKEELFDEPMRDDEPSFKAVLASLALFNMNAIRYLEALYRGERMEQDNYDDQNTEPAPPKAYKRVASDLRISHATVLAALERIPKDRFVNGQVPDWLEELVLDNYRKYIPEVEEWVVKLKNEGRGGPINLSVIQ